MRNQHNSEALLSRLHEFLACFRNSSAYYSIQSYKIECDLILKLFILISW